jgi:hypothetical protein
MSTKLSILERTGARAMLLPELITRGLAANDRLKYYLTLLQAAHAHATAPHQPAQTLRTQREASGVDDASLDQVVQGSIDRGGHSIYIPGACAIVESLFEELRRMLEPIRVAGAAHADLRGRVEVYQRRLDDLVAHAPLCSDDQMTASTIRALTKLSGNGRDTMHQLVVDLHWELNRLQTTISTESIDGASAYGVQDSDRGLVRAFMKGIHETAALKFDHPGLGTTAARDSDRLSIQNDLGMTPSHSVVIHVTDLSVAVRYTDIHHARVRFFQEMLQPYDVTWSVPPEAAGNDYEVCVGRFTADARDRLERYLTFLGSRLVFLIDWNRARKRLARLVGKTEAIGLLKWAAESNVGHRAFLKAGDIRLIEAALERAAPMQMHPGARLDEWLGRDAARSFLMAVLRVTSSGLRAGHSLSLIDDEIESELLRHMQTHDRHMFGEAADHAVVISALADRVRRTLMRLTGGEGGDDVPRPAETNHPWPAPADQIVRQTGPPDYRAGDAYHLRPLLRDADRAADAIDETAFLLTLIPEAIAPKSLSMLGGLADIVVRSVREYARCLEESRGLSAASSRSEIDGFLLTVDRLVDLGREAHAAKRAITERLLHGPAEFHELYVVASITHGFEQAAAALSRCGPIVRDYVLSSWSNG